MNRSETQTPFVRMKGTIFTKDTKTMRSVWKPQCEHTLRLMLNPVNFWPFPDCAAPLLLSWCWFSQTQGYELAGLFMNLQTVCGAFYPLFQLGGPCVLDWSVSLLYLIHTHTHTHTLLLLQCTLGVREPLWQRALGLLPACVEAYAFDFERLRVFEYVGEGPK